MDELSEVALPEVIAPLGSPVARVRTPAAQLSRAVTRGLRIGPRQTRDAAELVIGLPDRPTTMDAHAWMEPAGHDIGPAAGGRGYQVLTRHARDGRRTFKPAS